MIYWRAVMKFNPKLQSYIFALNTRDRLGDLCAIMEFCSVQPIELKGYWKGVPERSFQVDARFINVDAMFEVLTRYGQDAFLYISQSGTTYQCNVERSDEALGKMVQIPHQVANCTYCITTETYWSTHP